MCRRKIIPVRSVSPAGVRFAFVPCGKCYECMTLARNEWSTRLRCAIKSLGKFEDLDNYYGGFLTLTFNENSIPRIPRVLCKNYKMWNDKLYCFDREIGQKFCRSFRDHLRKKYGVVKPIYMFVSEFGENTARPHHHFFCYLPKFCAPLEIFNYIKRKWSRYGFICPRDFAGGLDSKGYMHRPFLCDNLGKSISYVCKYITKSIDFEEQFNKRNFYHETKNHQIKLYKYMPYHIQSRSLGSAYLDSLDEKQKIEVLKNGLLFNGYEKKVPLPLYFQRKLLYDTVYQKVDGKRLVRRKPSAFFAKFCEEIYQHKLDVRSNFYDSLFSHHFTKLCLSNSVGESRFKCALSFLGSLGSRVVAHYDILYFGLGWNEWTTCKTARGLLRRVDFRCQSLNVAPRYLVDYDFYCRLTEAILIVNLAYNAETLPDSLRKIEDERKLKRIKHFFKGV